MISKFLAKFDFKESKVYSNGDDPQTTPSDIALFFEKLYKDEFADAENTAKMLELLKNQQLNNKLPKLLPEGTIIAHKTGEIDYFSHDGGIVFAPKGDYIIVVFSKSDIPAAAEDRIAQISKEAYNYFNR